ncbi:type VI secretion-associated protein [Enterobacter hormaechei]|uniref:Type VI secretion system protein TssA n=1 Tax=Phytobacter ursingii TaxID=1972431 RepID=A0AB35RTA8_9ENTR|nr:MULTISPECIES: type VI secretion system protein TssA [Enterobacteriaceae]MDV2865178.1 type VI secretion system protein TssA [Phytobacter ursingii]GJL37726.1 type VI secretion-associated protein [Enterobacter hormaechei]
MDIQNPEDWLSHLLEALPEDKLAAKLSDENPQWEYIDGEIVKLGSLAHSQLDIPEIQRQGLVLLASESKDFRLLTHLLRTLQHAGNPLLALRMLTQYVTYYWITGWPQNAVNKGRLANQILKRFESGITRFASASTPVQRDDLLGELAKLAQCWQSNNMPELASATDDLFALYQRAFRDSSPSTAPAVASTVTTDTPKAVPVPHAQVTAIPAAVVNIDSHSDKAWRDTLLKVAAILCELTPDSPQGYRLRRHALWQTITRAPQAESDGRTPLAAVSADMTADYRARLAAADMVLWQQVENSLLLAPYWLDGHYLSAQIAQQLGYRDVAEAICDEVRRFVTRLPQLTALRFNDRTPFISDATRQWLADEPAKGAGSVMDGDELTQQVWQNYREHGLEAALALAEQQPQHSPRERFYCQYLTAQLLDASGMAQLAQQHYRMLFKTGLHTTLSDWEPSLLEQLEEKLTPEQ